MSKSTEPVQPLGNTQQGGTKHGDPDNEHQQPGFVDSLLNLDAGEWYVGHVERSIYEDDNEMLPPPECQKLHWAALHVEVIRRCCTKPGVRFSISVRISISSQHPWADKPAPVWAKSYFLHPVLCSPLLLDCCPAWAVFFSRLFFSKTFNQIIHLSSAFLK